MHDEHRAKLEAWGLSSLEAQVYLALLRNGRTLGASAVASAAGIPRPSVYPILKTLVEKGMVENGEGYGSRFTAISPDEALPLFMRREKEELSQRERLTGELVKELGLLAEPAERAGNNGEAEFIQVFRDPRVVGERFARLQDEAKREIDVFVKFPLFDPDRGNPAQEKAFKRGVRMRGIYERAIVEAPEIKPYLANWIAGGEDARVYNGELPHKLAIFDRQSILLPLMTRDGQARVLCIRHPQLATSLAMFFNFLWKESEPLALHLEKNASRSRKNPARTQGERNGAGRSRTPGRTPSSIRAIKRKSESGVKQPKSHTSRTRSQ